MPLTLETAERKESLDSLCRFLKEELEVEAGDLKTGRLLDYILEEIAPLAYNQGVRDSQAFLRNQLEELPGSCFEHGLAYWQRREKERK